jgi:hypothetical protein
MRVFAFVRRGARVGVVVLALGAGGAAAQQPPTENPAENSAPSTSPPAAKEPETVTPAEPAGAQATAPPTPATSTLPELVVNDDGKKKKKVVKTKQVPSTAPSSSESQAEATTPPPGVTLGTGAPSDTGSTTFDASNVKMRTDGSGDANTFMRNLPNVQYQNQASSNAGVGSQELIDTKPELMAISGGRTYENNFILNGVSITNITGPTDGGPDNLSGEGTRTAGKVYGLSPQNIYVPSDFIGQATIIDSNASAEYGQFQGGVVLYDLVAPPTDRYHASVSASRDSSDIASYILATPTGTNPENRVAPFYEKTRLTASIGAPITKDFSFIAQVSREEAESGKQKAVYISDAFAEENSDNIFARFAATVRTDIGKFTLDASHTDYFQHWEQYQGNQLFSDVYTDSWSTKLEYDAKLAGARIDAIGLGGVKLKARTFYNVTDTLNDSDGDLYIARQKQRIVADPANPGKFKDLFNQAVGDWCRGVVATTQTAAGPIQCLDGAYDKMSQGQTDYGVQANLTGKVLLGNFLLGTEMKQYLGRRERPQDWTASSGSGYNYDPVSKNIYSGASKKNVGEGTGAPFVCDPSDRLCTPEAFFDRYIIARAYTAATTLNALHAFAEIDQTLGWFNVRAGGRFDYDDYFKRENFAPRLVGTVTPFDGLSFTGGYNRYYMGETLYYALRDQQPGSTTYGRVNYDPDGPGGLPATTVPYNAATGTVTPFDQVTITSALAVKTYKTAGLSTPYDDEYSGSVGIKDPFLGGQLRLRYLERFGKEQFATVLCGNNCWTSSNDGEKFYRSATAEYTKGWSGLQNPFFLNAAAITGTVTWSKQQQSKNSYLNSSDQNGDGTEEVLIWYNGAPYTAAEFSGITGNLDIPVRFGATVSTLWFDGALELNASAGINLGFQGVAYGAGGVIPVQFIDGKIYSVYGDKMFNATLKLDVSGQINITEQAAIQFAASNITNSAQNAVTTDSGPWVLGRSFWLGSALRF